MADNTAKITLILGSNVHVPHGSPDRDFESVYGNIIKPFITNLYKFPKIQATLHYSGVLLHWIERAHQELFIMIRDMVSRRQVEFLGGGFYEPPFPLLSQQDKIGQIEFLTTYLRKQFGKRPLGCWLPNLAWEQNLAGPLSASGMSYTFLGEDQFTAADISAPDLYWPHLAEDQGKMVTVFPIFHSIEKELMQRGAQAVLKEVHEKISGWGGGIISVFPRQIYCGENEALDYAWNRFFEEISLSEDILECASPAKVYKTLKLPKRACFKDFPEHECYCPRRFLVEHSEANDIYAKIIFTNLLISQLRGDKMRKQSAREELWKAQGAGLFTKTEDLYSPSLRRAAYRSLLSAERITRENNKFAPSLLEHDFNFDGAPEYLFQEQKINCYVQSEGAGIFELDYLPKTWNYLDTCNFYGQDKSGLQKQSTQRRRTAFTDSFLPEAVSGADILNGTVTGGRYCSAEIYTVMDVDKAKGKVCFSLEPIGGDSLKGIPFGGMGIKKCYLLKKDTLSVCYTLCNHGKEKETFQFVPEIDLSFPGDSENFLRIFKYKTGAKDVPATEIISAAEALKFQDIKNEVQILLASEKPFDACIRHRYIAQGETSQYQSTDIMPIFAISLESGESWTNEFNLKISH